ncbi:MAG: mevalonate kinase [Methanobacterium sp.]|nr:mevalonate kinase [Methanobacterium sp.]
MKITASAPGKVILFGEHSVVYGKPAIAVAVNRHVHITIQEGSDTLIHVHSPELEVSGYLELEDETVNCENKLKSGILNYILKSLKKIQDGTGSTFKKGLEITLELEIPIGAGLGSSAAVTVATLAAAFKYFNQEVDRKKLAQLAHEVELEVQGAASPIDTALSTYGGAIYLSPETGEIINLSLDWNIPLVIGHTLRESNTAQLIKTVRNKKERYPSILNPLFESMEQITLEAREALTRKDENRLGELMNINHGLLDALGVNTPVLSKMIYLARESGAKGSKITGAGGGGSIIAYCPGKEEEVLKQLKMEENAFPIQISQNGCQVKKI